MLRRVRPIIGAGVVLSSIGLWAWSHRAVPLVEGGARPVFGQAFACRGFGAIRLAVRDDVGGLGGLRTATDCWEGWELEADLTMARGMVGGFSYTRRDAWDIEFTCPLWLPIVVGLLMAWPWRRRRRRTEGFAVRLNRSPPPC
jgi:hypothetical protein